MHKNKYTLLLSVIPHSGKFLKGYLFGFQKNIFENSREHFISTDTHSLS